MTTLVDRHDKVPLKALTLIWQKVFDICAAGKDAFKVDPPPLYINPNIKQVIDPVQSVLPCQGIIFKHLQVWVCECEMCESV